MWDFILNKIHLGKLSLKHTKTHIYIYITAFLQGLIEEHRIGLKNGGGEWWHHDWPKLQETQPEYYPDHMIKGLIQVINMPTNFGPMH